MKIYAVRLSYLFVFLFLTLCETSVSAQNDYRLRYTINNNWKFQVGDIKNAHKKSFDDNTWKNINIPHDFNGGIDGENSNVFLGRFDFDNDPDKRLMYKGPGWYRLVLNIEKKYADKRIFIEFEAVSLEAHVYVNGKLVGKHQGGYTAFSFDITDYIKIGTDNIIAVKADNSNNKNIAPWMADEKNSFPFSFDYAVYGGIYRDVWINITDQVKIEKVFNTPVIGGQAPAVLSVETRVKNYTKNSCEVTLNTKVYFPDGIEVAQMETTKNIESNATFIFSQNASRLGKVALWDVENPNLYSVKSTISYNKQQVDNYESTFGFRYYTLANNTAFVINGKKTMIKGVNRHQDMQGLGYALPNEQHVTDVQLIKNGGFNFIRHAHYPCDQAFAQACDEQGVMLWLEIPLTGSVSDSPEFLANCKNQLTEMIEQYYNNPSVMVWGIGNESDRSGASESVSNKVFGALVKLASELDKTRPTTGCNYQYVSNQQIVDVYSPQDWAGWYYGSLNLYKPTSIIGEYGSDMHYSNHTEQKFDINVDYGSANDPNFWSQEYGAFLHEYKASVAAERADSFPGQFIWVAFDFASPRLGRGMNSIPYMNQKGLFLHDHKTPKDVYYFYQSQYRSPDDYPMVYIVSESWTNRWTEPGVKDIWAYSNCDSVALYNDYGKTLLGTSIKNAGPRGDTRFQWDSINVQYNVLYAEGWYKNQIVARDTLILKNLPIKE
jgi:beta-galactosidase